jgi:hypothetical protein
MANDNCVTNPLTTKQSDITDADSKVTQASDSFSEYELCDGDLAITLLVEPDYNFQIDGAGNTLLL